MEKKIEANSSVLRRVLATVGCVLAFAVMASVFSPDRTRAGGINDDPWPGIPPKSIDYSQQHSGQLSPATSTSINQDRSQTVDPHEGLQSLGTIEDRGYTVHIYATDGGPRYTIYEKATNSECGALLTEAQVHQAYPDLQLPSLDFEANPSLMMVEPADELWW
jgi:hypothetical protein